MKLFKIKKAYWVVIILLIAGGSYYWYSQSKTGDKQVRYVAAAAEKGTLTISVTGTGQLEAVNQVDLKPVIAGDAIDIVRVYVENDQAVKKNDLIALLDSEDAQKSIRNAELDLESAKNKYDEIKKDYEDDEATKYAKNAQKLAVQQKENALSDAKAKLDDYYMRAPFDGVVTGLNVSAGDSVSRSDVLAAIITKDVQTKVVLNEIDVIRVKIGSKVVLSFDALPDVSLTGQVTKIDTIGTVSQGVVSYNAEILFDAQNELLKPGMSVSAAIITGVKQDVLIVPNSAVKSQNGSSFVQVLKDGQAAPQQVPVEVGMSNNTETEIISGINAGDKVVTQTIDPNATAVSSPAGGGFGGGGVFRALR